MKRVFATCLAIGMLSLHLGAQGKAIRADPLRDSLLLGAGALGAVLGHFVLGGEGGEIAIPADPASLRPIEAATLFPYGEGLSKASLAVECLAVASPAAFALVCGEGEAWPAALACAEALALTFAAKDLLKYAFPKARPYAYSLGPLDPELLEEADESFPSGHAALAFCSATILSVFCLELRPESPATPWLVAGSYGLALGASALRVVSGNHFLGDVAAGAALGSGIGWLVARAHLTEGDGASSESSSLELGPASLLVKIRL